MTTSKRRYSMACFHRTNARTTSSLSPVLFRSSLPRDGTMIDLIARIKEHLTGNPDCQSAKVCRTSCGQTNECRRGVGSFNFKSTAEFGTRTSCNLWFLTAWARATTTFYVSAISLVSVFPHHIHLKKFPTLPSVSVPFPLDGTRSWHCPERRQPTVVALLGYKETLLRSTSSILMTEFYYDCATYSHYRTGTWQLYPGITQKLDVHRTFRSSILSFTLFVDYFHLHLFCCALY
ncbi:uncharacterized protein F5147DRAFT_687995 [Suillus discolor]|uniref:Uncharacterized protein n=1 Tax=Suillus discolor TaxID=1912936 RepID=A0A9P7FB39_9AGAM|nr:uncharacterized protein F5147DRAFT_687995 [Suillus discolor]KAG2110953.1 hypothetical protein F5147DRAFT_687995 [Suillus discolor]